MGGYIMKLRWVLAPVLTTIIASSALAAAEHRPGEIGSAASAAEVAVHEPAAYTSAFRSPDGMFTEVIEQALRDAGQTAPSRYRFLGLDAPSLSGLSDRAEGMMFPVFKPDCASAMGQTSAGEALCEGFLWSKPLMQVVTSVYVHEKAVLKPRTNSDLMGLTVCQAGGKGADFLRVRGLTDLNSRLIRVDDPADCLRLVETGESDAAVVPMMAVGRAPDGVATGPAVQHVDGLDRVATVHAVADLSDTRAIADVLALDEGLAQLRDDGRWFEIIKAHHKARGEAAAQNAHLHDE